MDFSKFLRVLRLDTEGVELEVPGLGVLLDGGTEDFEGGNSNTDLESSKGTLSGDLSVVEGEEGGRTGEDGAIRHALVFDG